jgi:hypothetical protein
MEDSNAKNGLRQLRATVIESVRTPLGFFSLVALIAEAVLGSVAILIERPEKTYLVWSMIALLFLVLVLVAFLAVFRPEALSGSRPPRVLASTDEAKADPDVNVERIAQASAVDSGLVDPKLVRFIPPLYPTQFKILSLPSTEPPPYFPWPYVPTGTIPIYGIPFYLVPVTDPAGIPKGHLAVNVQPSQANSPATQIIEAKVGKAQKVHLLVSAGHGWRMYEGVQFLNQRIGYVRFRFADGMEQKIDLILGKHLREWAFGNHTDLVTELDSSLARPAWLSHDSTRRFDLLSLDVARAPRDLDSIEVTAEFEDSHPGRLLSTPAVMVSAITIERSVQQLERAR